MGAHTKTARAWDQLETRGSRPSRCQQGNRAGSTTVQKRQDRTDFHYAAARGTVAGLWHGYWCAQRKLLAAAQRALEACATLLQAGLPYQFRPCCRHGRVVRTPCALSTNTGSAVILVRSETHAGARLIHRHVPRRYELSCSWCRHRGCRRERRLFYCSPVLVKQSVALQRVPPKSRQANGQPAQA